MSPLPRLDDTDLDRPHDGAWPSTATEIYLLAVLGDVALAAVATAIVFLWGAVGFASLVSFAAR